MDAPQLGQARKKCYLTSSCPGPAQDGIKGSGTVDPISLFILGLHMRLDGTIQLQTIVQPGQLIERDVRIILIMRQIDFSLLRVDVTVPVFYNWNSS